mmetsp:Transcript_18837/g.30278  ORF Transcript_18837/g.30278 Transcript_18837/m.30278 type:complete len:95 (-) Transcript_18837:123-407(-)
MGGNACAPAIPSSSTRNESPHASRAATAFFRHQYAATANAAVATAATAAFQDPVNPGTGRLRDPARREWEAHGSLVASGCPMMLFIEPGTTPML